MHLTKFLEMFTKKMNFTVCKLGNSLKNEKKNTWRMDETTSEQVGVINICSTQPHNVVSVHVTSSHPAGRLQGRVLPGSFSQLAPGSVLAPRGCLLTSELNRLPLDCLPFKIPG